MKAWSTFFVLAFVAVILACHDISKDDTAIEVCHESPDQRDSRSVVRLDSEDALRNHLAHGDSVFAARLDGDCDAPLTIRIDPSVQPRAQFAPGFRGGPLRPLGAVLRDGGGSDEYILNEIIVRPEDPDALQDLLERYGGTVLGDDTVLIGTADGGTQEIPGGAEGVYLVSFDASKSSISDLPRNASEAGLAGNLTFSSIEAAAGVAFQLRELPLHPAQNVAYYPTDLNEHPDDDGSNIDFAEQWWMEDDSRPSVPGDQGLSTSVARALDYLRDSGLPPAGGLFEPAFVAVIDAGFALDPETGLGSADYNNDPFSPPLQVDAVNFDGRAGGSVGGWHGEKSFGACCAYPRNLYGGAGTGGNLVRPIVIRAGTNIAGEVAFFSFDVHMGIRSAWLMGADVISLSIGCSRDLLGETGPLCALNNAIGGNIQLAVFTAIADGVVVLAGAGNGDDNNIGDDNLWPCELDKVICVGGINRSGNNVYNWGGGVDIYAPSGFRSTVTPKSSDEDDDDVGADELAFFNGTSSATPFTAGIVGLLKAADSSLRWDDVQEILQNTANCAPTPSPCPSGTPDPHVHKGYVDALRAVQAVRANPSPEVQILGPTDGANVSWGSFEGFSIRVDDQPAIDFVGEIIVVSERDGEVCRLPVDGSLFFCPTTGMSVGAHAVTVTAIDQFGASGEATVALTLRNSAPTVSIASPPDGSTFFSSQLVVMRVGVTDVDETIGDSNIGWESNIDGSILSGTTPREFTTSLSVGTHSITARATDAQGVESSDSVAVTILAGDGHPTARIISPATGGNVFPGTLIMLEGEGTDPEDGILTPDALQWFSNVDGPLGSGPMLELVLTGSGCGNFTRHTITLKVTDSDAREHTDSIIISVGQIC